MHRKGRRHPTPRALRSIACSDATEPWPALTRYADRETFAIDNNPVENSIRPFAIEKNCLYAGSKRDGKRAAAIPSYLCLAPPSSTGLTLTRGLKARSTSFHLAATATTCSRSSGPKRPEVTAIVAALNAYSFPTPNCIPSVFSMSVHFYSKPSVCLSETMALLNATEPAPDQFSD